VSAHKVFDRMPTSMLLSGRVAELLVRFVMPLIANKTCVLWVLLTC
jgi:hypothetical protein